MPGLPPMCPEQALPAAADGEAHREMDFILNHWHCILPVACIFLAVLVLRKKD